MKKGGEKPAVFEETIVPSFKKKYHTKEIKVKENVRC